MSIIHGFRNSDLYLNQLSAVLHDDCLIPQFKRHHEPLLCKAPRLSEANFSYNFFPLCMSLLGCSAVDYAKITLGWGVFGGVGIQNLDHLGFQHMSTA